MPGATYAWTGPNGYTSTTQNPVIANATAANSGTYTVVATVNGCSSNPATVNVVINANTVPNITVSGSLLTSSVPTGNQWYFNNTLIAGATSQSYIATQTGWYKVIVTAGNCSNTSDSVFVNVDGISQLPFSQTVKVYPNPFTNTVSVDMDATTTDAVLLITDLAGREVSRMELSSAHSNITLNELPQGTYFFHISSREGQATFKLMRAE